MGGYLSDSVLRGEVDGEGTFSVSSRSAFRDTRTDLSSHILAHGRDGAQRNVLPCLFVRPVYLGLESSTSVQGTRSAARGNGSMKDRPWITHDKRRIPLSEMEDDHLDNCIRMIERGYGTYGRVPLGYHRAMYKRLLAEKERRQPAWFRAFKRIFTDFFAAR